MKKKTFKIYKLNKLKDIKTNYKFIYIFRYHDLKISENINLKRQIQELNYKTLVINQNLLKRFFFNIKGQGSILLIYGNNYNNSLIFKIQNIFKKLEFIYLINNNNIYSNQKTKKIINNKITLNNSIINPFLFFLYYLRKIKN